MSDPPKTLPFILVFDRQGKEAGRFLLREGENWAGIGIEEENYTPQIDLEPYDLHHFVSRRHAVIRKAGDVVTIEHVGKTNPTAVNGKVLKRGEPAPLAPNDTIVFANRIPAKFVVESFPSD